MLNLPKPSSTTLDKYFSLIENYVLNALNTSSLSRNAKLYLTTSRIREIIVGEPQLLKDFHNDIIPLLGARFSIREYKAFLKAKKKRVRSITESRLVRRYARKIHALETVFDYDSIISGKKDVSYQLAKMLDRSTCTYCNRLYTITVSKNNSPNEGITRPQFDHWYSKKRYPILALSFYNLIPSCSVCNSTVKGDTDFKLSRYYHPYLDSFLKEFKFSYNLESAVDNNVTIKYVAGSAKAKRTLSEFKIQEIYNAHSLLELKDLIELKGKYSDSYLKTLFEDLFKGLSVHRKDAYRYLFGTEYKDREFHKRPMSKFKKDIIKELRLL